MTGYARLVAPVVVVSLLFGALPAQAGSGPASARVRVVASAPAGVSPASAKPVGMEVASQAGVESAGLTVGSAAVAGDTGQGSRDAEDASALALRSGQRVAIESLTTGTDLVWATPSGAVGREIYGSPVRVRRGGAWVPVDTSLVAGSAGWWVPRAGLADVAVSDKPAGAAVRVRVDGATARLGSVVKRSGSPRVSGSSMVWPSGLTVSALKQGVSLSWPFTTGREVAEGAVVGELRAGVRGARWRRIRATGGVALVGAGGARLGSLGPVLVESAARRRSGDPVAVLRLRLVPVGSGATARLRLVATSAIPTGFRGRANHSWASGGASDTWVQKNLYETSQQSSFRDHYGRRPTKSEKGPGSEWSQARKYFDRQPR